MKKIPIGVIDYRCLKTDHFYVVDKSLMIKEFLDRQTIVTLVTRPRRFGKTLNMSMMAEFFDITKDSKDIFKDTNIMKTEYASYINQYPTIFISFANAKGEKSSYVEAIKLAIRFEYQRYSFIFKSLDFFDEAQYKHITKKLFSNENTIESIDGCSISFLMNMLEKYYHKTVMLFIDDYDNPIIEAQKNGFYDEVRGSLSSMFFNCLKTSNSLQYALLTSVYSVNRENCSYDLNSNAVYDVTSRFYDKYFGFDEKEVEELLTYYGLELNEEVKLMYGGYHIGERNIYNPYSIVKYADQKQLIPYWINTNANMIITNALKQSNRCLKKEFEELILNGKLDTLVQMDTSLSKELSVSGRWGSLVNEGYLTIDKVIDSFSNYYTIRIPNQEIQRQLINLIEYELSIHDAKLSNMFRYLIDKKQEKFLKEYKNILLLPSYHD